MEVSINSLGGASFHPDTLHVGKTSGRASSDEQSTFRQLLYDERAGKGAETSTTISVYKYYGGNRVGQTYKGKKGAGRA